MMVVVVRTTTMVVIQSACIAACLKLMWTRTSCIVQMRKWWAMQGSDRNGGPWHAGLCEVDNGVSISHTIPSKLVNCALASLIPREAAPAAWDPEPPAEKSDQTAQVRLKAFGAPLQNHIGQHPWPSSHASSQGPWMPLSWVCLSSSPPQQLSSLLQLWSSSASELWLEVDQQPRASSFTTWQWRVNQSHNFL